MILKTEPTVNGYNVEFIGNNKKGENLKLKVWIDALSFNEIIANPIIDIEIKVAYLQSTYDDKQELRRCERCGNFKIISLESLREETGFEPEYNDPNPIEIEETKLRADALQEAIAKTLTKNEKFIIQYKYNEEIQLTTKEISKALSKSERHVRRLHKQALEKLKKFLIDNYPEVFINFK